LTHSANAFANAYDTNFKVLTKGFSHFEIPLFQAMHSSLIGLSGAFEVEEYHGTSHQVIFTGNGSYARMNARCELSDLMIITFSSITRSARLTYLQAKSERATLGSVGGYKFAANLEQWYLLAKRPQLKGIGKFNPPLDLLSNALLPSVGSFAFFYKNSLGDFEAYYSTADHLYPVSSYTQRYGKLQAKDPCHVSNSLGYSECRAACGNFSFAKSLYSLEIGTPVDSSASQAMPTRNWLASVLRYKIRQSQQSDGQAGLARELLEILSAENTNEEQAEFGAKQLLIIKSNFEPNDLLNQTR